MIAMSSYLPNVPWVTIEKNDINKKRTTNMLTLLLPFVLTFMERNYLMVGFNVNLQ